ncbi:MAG: YfhO family protein [Candidatus Azobacteroides sp.]|nr:YfhO family protein [Candidatus Azobacteroides sp.]
MNKDFWKKILPYVVCVAIFAVISVGYFTPDIFEGKVLFQHDTRQGIANGEEIGDFYKKTGEHSRWTNALFSGMPTFQIAPGYESSSLFRKIEKLYRLFLPSPAFLIFIMLLGFFILLKALDIRTSLAALGAVLYAFSSYFFIIISAGHIWKFTTLAYIPPTIGGIILIYKGRYWSGGIVTALFAALQISSNHMQMSYYFGFVVFAFLTVFFIDAFKKKEWSKFIRSTAVLMAAGTVAVCINISNLYQTYEYSKQTIRGKSELTHNIKNQTSSGLERDYIVQWSYGIGETWSLLIPNVKGGASGALGYSPDKNTGEWKRDKFKNKEAFDKINSNYRETIAQQSSYWGDQPGTSGPVYIGAFVFALFVLGLFIVKGNIKWALLILTVLSILLSWGKNFMPFTDFFLDYLPMYNKFRAVSSTLVIAEFTIPLLAILALKEMIEHPAVFKEKKKLFWTGIGMVVGITFLFALFPDAFFDFLSTKEKEAFLPQAKADPQAAIIIQGLQDVRISIFRSDAWRSFLIILIGSAFLLAFASKKISATALVVCLAVLCFFDMASVNKRYLSGNNFVVRKETKEPYPETDADKIILQDPTLYYRVLNGSVDSFNDAGTSYRHKSIGGYHAAKLRRYQDLIEHQLTKEITRNIYAGLKGAQTPDDVMPFLAECNNLNMLNMRYFIYNPGQPPLKNPYACGNAWFVDEIKQVNNADEEMAALDNFNPLKTVIVDKRFAADLPKMPITPKDSLSSIVLTAYAPNKLTFKTQTSKNELAVFSDIYYPGWKAVIDGKEVPIVRADYVLRALPVPSGNHTVEFTFDPQSVHTTEAIAYTAIILLLLGSIGFIGFKVYKYVGK